jgi:GH15 family glucan-1,4-alpha-glucosidase
VRSAGAEKVAAEVPAIADYGLLSDCQGAALVSRDGSIDWWCPARFDAPSVFGRMLDENAGHWTVRPVENYRTSRRYVEDSMVVESDFRCRQGLLRLTDALALGSGERGHAIGYTSPHVLVRHLAVLEGEVEVEIGLAPRLEYGLVRPQLTVTATGLEAIGGADRLSLVGDRRLEVEQGSAVGRFSLRTGETAAFVLQHWRSPASAPAPLDGRALLRDTVAGWQSWSQQHRGYQGPYPEAVQRSALVLQALTYRPTGAVIAAATTSLPEEIGGSANWDYRFGWLRDGSLTLKALWVAACPDEGHRFFTWIAESVGSDRSGQLPIMFGAAGERDLTEHQLDHLAGFASSQPVRIGNDAWKQKQLDVLGEVLECAWVLRDQLGDLTDTTAAFLRSVADRAASTWSQTDAGMWEGREGQRHYLSSKLLCWVALDRAVRLAGPLQASEDEMQRWESARDEVRGAILERGWSDEVKAFTGAFGSDHLDASVLLMPIVGFLAGDDERVIATLDAVERELCDDALVQRWTGAGDEGAFVICSYWLAAGWALAGQVDRAKAIFEKVTGCANDLGLLSEEVHKRDGRLIGNFPQALSHIGLVNAAWTISQAEASRDGQ